MVEVGGRTSDQDMEEIFDLHQKWLAGEDGGEQADFSGQMLDEEEFEGEDLRKALFRGTRLSGTKFWECNLEGADFSSAILFGAAFAGSNCKGANFKNADLGNVFFSGLPEDWAAWAGSDPEGFEKTSPANLSRANLVGASLEGAFLAGVDLRGAKVTREQLGDANMEPSESEEWGEGSESTIRLGSHVTIVESEKLEAERVGQEGKVVGRDARKGQVSVKFGDGVLLTYPIECVKEGAKAPRDRVTGVAPFSLLSKHLGKKVIVELMAGGRHIGTLSKGPFGPRSFQVEDKSGKYKFSVKDLRRLLVF